MYFPKYVSLLCELLIVTLFLASTLCSGFNETKPSIYIGGFFSCGGMWVSEHIIPSVNLALHHINESPTILPEYELKMVWNDTQCNHDKATQALYYQLNNQPTKLAIIGDGCSVSSRVIAANAGFWKLTTVSYAATSPSLSNRQEFPYFFRTIIPDSRHNPVRIHLMREFRWNRVAILHGTEDIFLSAVNDFKKLLAEENITLITSQEVTPKHIDEVIDYLKEEDTKIIVLNMYAARARQVFCEAYHKGMLGEGYVWIILGWYRERWWEETNGDEEHFNCTKENMTEAVQMSYYIATEMQQVDTSGHVTEANITANEYELKLKEYLNQTEYKYDAHGYLAYDAAWAIALMLDNASRSLDRNLTTFTYGDTELTEVFYEALSDTHFLGVSGEVQFDSSGDRTGKIQIRQLQQSKEHLIALYDDITDEIEWHSNFTWQGGEVPADKTEPKKIRVHVITRKYFLPVFALSTLGILLCVFLFLFNTIYRNKRCIKISSPGMNNLIILGGLMTYCVVFPMSLENTEKQQVMAFQAFLCLGSLGFILGFGAMVTKTWRIYRIAVFKTPKRVVIKNKMLYIIVGGMVAIDVVILSVLCSFVDIKHETETMNTGTKNINGVNTTFYYTYCAFSHMEILYSIHYAYHCILATLGIFLAWQTRKVTIDGLNDSKVIALCIYKFGFIFVACILYTMLVQSNPVETFIVRSAFNLYYVTFALIVIFVPKIKAVFFDDDPSSESGPPRNTVDTACGDIIDDLSDRLSKAESEMKRLEKINQRGGPGNRPPSGCGMWCCGNMCGCCTSPDLWKVSPATTTANTNIGD